MNDRFKFRVWNDMQKCYSQDDHYIDEDGQLNTNGKYIIEQCTGIKGKNGKLIYEGDVVTEGADMLEVVWDYNAWCIQTNKFQQFLTEGFEVVGNIHENADLLENEE